MIEIPISDRAFFMAETDTDSVQDESEDVEEIVIRMPASNPHKPWAIAAVVIVITIAITVAYISTLKAAKEVMPETIEKAAEKIETIAEKFKTGTIHTTWRNHISSITVNGTDLEVASLKSDEFFTHEDEKRVFWEYIPLGKNISQIKVPVTYRYHIDLSEDWVIEVKDNVCAVVAPRIRPTLPVAIETDKMEKKVDEGWLRFDGEEQLTDLEKNITPALAVHARKNLDNVREHARQAVAKFVRQWLMKEDHWRENRFTAVQVSFMEELEDVPKPVEKPPTLELEKKDGEETNSD